VASDPMSKEVEDRMFFFEKKNQKTISGCFARSWTVEQKTSALRAVPATGVAQRREKFFGSFFQKRTSFLLCFS
jgi:hypothetical protein